jgi:hypothetical protein
MPDHPADPAQSQVPPHQHSCTVCRQRKVKCDKQQRCSNCIKAGIECVYTIPAKPRRRVGNIGVSLEDLPKEELVRRLRRYEALFRNQSLKGDEPVHRGSNGQTEPVSTAPGFDQESAPKYVLK